MKTTPFEMVFIIRDKRRLHLKDKFFRIQIGNSQVDLSIVTFKNVFDLILIRLATMIKTYT